MDFKALWRIQSRKHWPTDTQRWPLMSYPPTGAVVDWVHLALERGGLARANVASLARSLCCACTNLNLTLDKM